jgi:hypothetical protein
MPGFYVTFTNTDIRKVAKGTKEKQRKRGIFRPVVTYE